MNYSHFCITKCTLDKIPCSVRMSLLTLATDSSLGILHEGKQSKSGSRTASCYCIYLHSIASKIQQMKQVGWKQLCI